MELNVPESEYEAIETLIASDASPVGIDAKKTHVLIMHMLMSIEKRLARLEAAVGEPAPGKPTPAPGHWD